MTHLIPGFFAPCKEFDSLSCVLVITRVFCAQVSSAARQALRRAVAEAHPLLVEAMLLCELSSTSDVLSGAPVSLAPRCFVDI